MIHYPLSTIRYPLYITLLCLLFVVSMVPCYGSDTDEATYNYLRGLDIEELIQVEVTLDEAFDVFDGLIKARKVSIATGHQQAATRAPAVTTVITAQDIEAIGARDLDEVLETVPGLHVARDTQGYRPIYTIRGIYTTRNPEVLMLINGIPITALYTGDRGFMWGGMPTQMISRIEVIRGPGSAVYGADAFAGVINVMTKTKEDIQGTEVGARVGSFKTYESWILHGDTWHGVDLATSLSYHTTDGPNRIVEADAQTQLDKLFGTHASRAPGPANTESDGIDARIDAKRGNWQARAGYQSRRHLGMGTGLAQALAPEAYATLDRTQADLTYHNPAVTSAWDVTAQLSYFDLAWEVFENRAFPRGAFGGAYPEGYIGNPGVSERRFRFDTFAFYAGFQRQLIRLGIGYHLDDQYQVTSTQNFGINPATGLPLPPGSPLVDISDTPYIFNREAQRNSWNLSLQDTWTITDTWELTAGIRHDDYSDFGATTNPRVALVWQPHQDVTGKLMYGRAFRAPSFNESYDQNNPVALGNPNLKPEIINTWEWALDYRAMSNLHLAVNVFRCDMDDKIGLVPSADGQFSIFENVGHWKGEGLEVEARWKMTSKSSLLANYSYANTSDKSDERDIGGYPHHSAYLRTDWLLIPKWYLDVQAKWIANRQRSLGDPRPAIADYTTVDLTLRYKDVREGRANLALSVRNLFNADVREPSLGPDSKGMISIPNDLPTARRSVFLEWRYRF